jgi:hypothetical protein
MVKLQQGIHSFFKRKRDELNNENEVVEEEQDAYHVHLIQLIEPENHRQEQEQPIVFWPLSSWREIQHYVHKYGTIQATSKMKCICHT